MRTLQRYRRLVMNMRKLLIIFPLSAIIDGR
jgi:hypothetical protein